MPLNQFEFNLTSQEARKIKLALANIKYDALGSDDFIFSVRKAAYQSFPIWLLKLLEKQKTSLKPLSHIIINNFMLDDYITGSPTFHQTGTMFKSGCVSENIITAIGAIIGEPYSIHFEGQELINNLTPQHETKSHYTGLGSDVELDLHIENSALRFMGDADCSPLGLLLLGVREQKESTPYTNIVDVRSILNDITECNLNILRGNNYIIRVPYRWIPAFSGDNQNTKPCPMITGEGDLVRINAVFYPDMVLALTHEAKIAFDNLYFALRHKMIKINITPGKLVYIDNRVALHSRDRFTAQYDANGAAYRWIQRLFIMPNLWPMQNFSKVGPRVFDPGNSAYPNLAINNQILYNDALNDFDSNCSQNIQ